MAGRVVGISVLAATALVLAGCAHAVVQDTKAKRLADTRQTILSGVGLTSKANGYFTSLRDDGTGFAWMKGDKDSRGVKWALRDTDLTGKASNALLLCLGFGPAINFPQGRVFCTSAADWQPAGGWVGVPPQEN